MKVWVCVASSDEGVKKFVGIKKAGIIPSDLLNARHFGGLRLKVRASAFAPESKAPTPDEFEEFVLRQSADLDAVIVLFDDGCLRLIERLRGSCFCVPIAAIPHRSKIQNAIHGATARALKGWWQVQKRFLEGKDIKILSLPLRNFQADELLQLANAVRAVSPALPNDLEGGLKHLRTRLRPRQRSERKTLYLVDDAKRFYVYGHERHARPETGGDHAASCAVNARFRFGCRIDHERHYNVSESEGDKTTISGKFRNCHDIETEEKRTTHLNMFASDMYY